MKILTALLFCLLTAACWASTPDSVTNIIEVEKTDVFCESGLDIDSCAYLPLYHSFYEWLGAPYKYAGQSKKGVDCSAFTKAVIREAYGTNLSGSSRTIYKKCNSIKKKDLEEGDFVFFKINKDVISHIGIYLQDGYFVHASVSKGVMINNLNEKYYKKYFYDGGRLTNE